MWTGMSLALSYNLRSRAVIYNLVEKDADESKQTSLAKVRG